MNAARRWWSSRRPVVAQALAIAGLVVCPVVVATLFLGDAWSRDILGIDIESGLLPPAQAIREGVSPFEVSHYPPLIPVALVPFTWVPSAGVVISALALLSLGLTLWALGIRDWRCYGAALLWPPVLSGVQTANATLFLVCASALAWRHRERAGATAVAAGLAIGAKLISWPLAAWLAATGRRRAAVGAVVTAAAVTIALGALLEVALRSEGGTSFGMVATSAGTPSYSVLDVSRSLGVPTWLGMIVLGCLTFTLVILSIVLGRAGDDTRSFCVACLACLVGSPNVWLHSFSFLLPVFGLFRPRFTVLWIAPLLFVLVPVNDPSAVEIAFAWLLAAALSLWLLGSEPRRRSAGVPASVQPDAR